MPPEITLNKTREDAFKSTDYVLQRGNDILLGVNAYLDVDQDYPIPYYAMFWRGKVDLESFLEAVNKVCAACIEIGYEADTIDSDRAFPVGTAHIRGEGSGLEISSSLSDSDDNVLAEEEISTSRRSGTVIFNYPYNLDQLLQQDIDLENVLAIRVSTPYGDFGFDDTDFVRKVQANYFPNDQPMIGVVTQKPIIEEFVSFIQATSTELLSDDVRPLVREIAERL